MKTKFAQLAVPSYMTEAFFSPLALAKRIANHLKSADSMIEFDSIAVRGNSGITVGPIVAELLGKNLVIVNKSGTYTHSEREVIYSKFPNKFIIIDDLIASGGTVAKIISAISDEKKRMLASCDDRLAKLDMASSFYSPEYKTEQKEYSVSLKEHVSSVSPTFVGGYLYASLRAYPHCLEVSPELFDGTKWIGGNDETVFSYTVGIDYGTDDCIEVVTEATCPSKKFFL